MSVARIFQRSRLVRAPSVQHTTMGRAFALGATVATSLWLAVNGASLTQPKLEPASASKRDAGRIDGALVLRLDPRV